MKFSEFKRDCVGRLCKIVKSEYWKDASWIDDSARHKFLNIPRKILKITSREMQFETSGGISYCGIKSAACFVSTENGFIVQPSQVPEPYEARLTYEFVKTEPTLPCGLCGGIGSFTEYGETFPCGGCQPKED